MPSLRSWGARDRRCLPEHRCPQVAPNARNCQPLGVGCSTDGASGFLRPLGLPVSDAGSAAPLPSQIYFRGLSSEGRWECFSLSAPDHEEERPPIHFTGICEESAESILSGTKLHFMKPSLFCFICQAGLLKII